MSKIFLGLIALLLLSGCADVSRLYEISGHTMGTTYSIKLYSDEKNDTTYIQKLIDKRLHEINRQMSTYEPDSEISRFNKLKANVFLPIGADFSYVLKAALEISRETKGAFDVTLMPLVDLWGFAADFSVVQPPAPGKIEKTRQFVGYQKIAVKDSFKIGKKHSEVQLDLSAIAKGYAVDVISKLLLDNGYKNHLVEIGGEVKAMGKKPGGNLWQVAVIKPVPTKKQAQQIIVLENQAVATSGDYRNFFEHAGKRYSHIIDPGNGYPVSNGVTSVSVVADDAMTADAMATAFMVMGVSKGVQLAKQQNLAVLFILNTPEGLITHTTPGFEKLVAVGQNHH